MRRLKSRCSTPTSTSTRDPSQTGCPQDWEDLRPRGREEPSGLALGLSWNRRTVRVRRSEMRIGGFTHPWRIWPDVVWDVSNGRETVPKCILKVGRGGDVAREGSPRGGRK